MKLEVISDAHNLDRFSCENITIDDFLKSEALVDNNELLSKTYVAVDNDKIVAFCTLILHSLKPEEKEFYLNVSSKRTIKQRIPALLIGQLAVDKNFKNKKIGASLIKKVIEYAIATSDYIHFPVIIVDADNEDLVSYYEKQGFTKFPDKRLRLFLPMADILKTKKAS